MMRFFGVVFPYWSVALAISSLATATSLALHAEPAPRTDASPPRADAPARTDAPPRADAAPNPAKITHLAFDIEREGNKIGATMIDLERQNDVTSVKVATNISVKVMFIEAYRYEHTAAETWKGGQLTSYKSRTNDNGTKHTVDVSPGPTPDKLILDVDGKRGDVPKAIVPASLWSKDIITNRSELFEPANGKRLSIKVKDLGDETLTLRGVKHQTRHYKIADKTPGEFDRDLWFEGDVLVRMKLLGSDHSVIISDLR